MASIRGFPKTKYLLRGAAESDHSKRFCLSASADDLPCQTTATVGRSPRTAPLPLQLRSTAFGLEVWEENQNPGDASGFDRSPPHFQGYFHCRVHFFGSREAHRRIPAAMQLSLPRLETFVCCLTTADDGSTLIPLILIGLTKNHEAIFPHFGQIENRSLS